MESDREPFVPAGEAAQQLRQLDGDRRWVRLVRACPDGQDAAFGATAATSLLLFGAAAGELGSDPSGLGNLAFVYLVLFSLGQGHRLRRASGSWLGERDKRPTASELAVVVMSFAAGLVAVVVGGAHRLWLPTILAALAVGVVWAVAYHRWATRYREEYGYRSPRRAYLVTAPLMVVFVVGISFLITYAVHALGLSG